MRYPRQSRLSGNGIAGNASGRVLHARGRQVICPNRAGPIIHHHHGRLVKPAGGVVVHSRWDDILAGWTLNEESGERADVLSVLNATDNNTVTFAAGKVGNAASYVHTNSEYLDFEDPTDILDLTAYVDVGKGLTITSWVDLNAGPIYPVFVAREDNRQYEILWSGGSFILYVGTALQRSVAQVLGAWHLLGCRFTGAGGNSVTTSISLDGAAWSAESAARNVLASSNSRMMLSSYGASVDANGIVNGEQDETYFFGNIKDDAWIAGMYNGGSGVGYPD